MQDVGVLGCKLSKAISFSQDEELYIATSDTKIKMEEDYIPFVDKVLNDISFIPSRILDLGCGPGYIARRICEVLPNSSVFGADKSPVMINHAEKVVRDIFKKQVAFITHKAYKEAFAMLRNEGYLSNYRLKYIVADSSNLPFEDCLFDLIILKGTFKCLEDKQNSLKEIYRVLSPGGEVFIYEFRKDIAEDEFNFLTKDMKLQKANSLRRKLNCSLDIGEYEKYLKDAGLKDNCEIIADGLDLRIRIFKRGQDKYEHYGRF